MSFRCANRRGLSSWLIAAILFIQIATSAYACPMNRLPADDGQDAMAGMPCAEAVSGGVALDADQPGLCQQHCQQGTTQQPVDQTPLPLVQPAAMVPLFSLDPPVPAGADHAQFAAHERRRDHAPPPARSILLCCYRI
ncbi:hypothetical protein [Rivibacter subsaxonicus]|uniref:Copper resistance protein n=1 Tax=Rivibacter subsaxonicus TaxID=457575 RepID=A0A4Q7VW22_9BURK|nr:hypothetical protein [Rivibacter subsaxonicus]RZU00894.1 hypothetical protein EV670_1607 [Rivibacter subsaxonicus]